MKPHQEYDIYLKIYLPVFESVFESNFQADYFGIDLDKTSCKIQQWDWFCDVVEMIVDGKTDALFDVLHKREYKITREYVSKIINKNIVREIRENILEIVMKEFAI